MMLVSLTTKAYPGGMLPSVACDDEFTYQTDIDAKQYNSSIFVAVCFILYFIYFIIYVYLLFVFSHHKINQS